MNKNSLDNPDYLQEKDRMIAIEKDFYTYVNEDWIKNNPIPDDHSIWAAFSEVNKSNEDFIHKLLNNLINKKEDLSSYEKLVKIYYESIMDTDKINQKGLDDLRILINDIDNLSLNNLSGILAKLHLLNVNVLFDISIQPDFDNTAKYLIYINQDGLGMPDRDYYLAEKYRTIKDYYKKHIENQFNNIENSTSSPEINKILNFENMIAKKSYSKEKLRDLSLTLKKYTLKELINRCSLIDFKNYFKKLGIDISDDTEICVDNIFLLEEINNLISKLDTTVLRGYFKWHLIRKYATSLNNILEDEHRDFYEKKLLGVKKNKKRWEQAIRAMTKDIGEALSHLYVDNKFTISDKKRVEEMVNNILQAMRDSLKNNTWMSPLTKKEALTKLSKFKYKIGYPEVWRDYSKLILKSEDSYFKNKLAIISYETKRNIKRLNKPVDQKEWEMPAHIVNAYYNPLKNMIVFPAGILQPPFYGHFSDNPSIYGAIGAVIGHEITHGFDDHGSQFDGDGHFRVWWQESDKQEFNKRTAELVKQYNNYTPLPNQKINGKLTLGENIADLGGLSLALRALRIKENNLTDSDIRKFFHAYATIWRNNIRQKYLSMLLTVDPHSPGKYRVNGVLKNMNEFYRVFNVKKDDSSKRIEIW